MTSIASLMLRRRSISSHKLSHSGEKQERLVQPAPLPLDYLRKIVREFQGTALGAAEPLDLVGGFKQHVAIILGKSYGKLVQPLNNIT